MAHMVTVGRKPATLWKIVIGVLLLLAAAGNIAQRPPAGGMAESLGSLAGLAVIVFGAVFLIASGMPKTLGNTAFIAQRRRLWLKYMVVGFVVMMLSGLGLAQTGFTTASAFAPAFYWFVWSWLSWKIADQKCRAVTLTSEQPIP